MKRVFAFISLFAIALVMFGFATSNVKAAAEPADGKWFENPYLLTDDEGNVVEIPMYIMNSITTTFPDFFDYEGAKGTEFEDKNWGGTVRQYAWNGVKVIIPQFDAEGPTGKYYGIYPQGASKGGQVGIGGMIYTTSGQWDKGTWYEGGSYARNEPHDPSLSFYLFNDKDVAENITRTIMANNQANPWLVFDGEGKAVAGLMFPDTSAGVVETAYGLGQEFCWDENGVGVVANADASNCAKVLVDGEEDDLDKPILDENGDPTGEYEKVKVPGDDPDYIGYRYVWQYMEEKPANLNNGYLNDGWKADNWDFYNEETGIAVCLLSSYFANGGAVAGAELTADETISAGHIRAPFQSIELPAGGLLYKLGYLERGSTLLPTYKEVQAQAYFYGRDEAYSQTIKCYNYATRDIKFVETALDGLGYSLIEGTNTIEAVAGAQIDFDKLIDLNGVAYCFTDTNDQYSFQSAILSADQEKALFDSKKAEFLAAAIEEIKVSEDYKEAYGDYQEWLNKQLAAKAQLDAAIEKAQAELDAAIANRENILATAEQEIKNSTNATVKAAYQAKLDAITAAEKAIANQKELIVKKEEAIEVAKKALEEFEVNVRNNPEYLGYKQALTHAYKNFKDTLKTVYSYVALELGNTGITMADLKYTAVQTEEEDYKVTFANATLAAAYAEIVAAVEATYSDDDTRAAAIKVAADKLTAAFCIEAGNAFEVQYTAKVDAFVKSVTNLAIANKAIRDYIQLSDAKRALYVADVTAAENALADAVAVLGTETPATGLYKKLEDAKADKEAYIVEYIKADKNYKDAEAAIVAKQAALDAAKAALGTPSTATTPATGWYVDYEKEALDMNRILTDLAQPFADEDFADWQKNVYYDQMSLDYTVLVNGEMVVFKAEFQSKEDFLNTFFAEFYAYCVEEELIDGNAISLEKFMHADPAAKDFAGAYTSAVTGAGAFQPFLNENKARWEAAYNLFEGFCKAVGRDMWASPWGTYSVMFKNYCQGKTHASYGPATVEEAASYPKPTAWDEFVLEMSYNLNEKTEVEVIVKNPILGKESSLDLDFVVMADAYDATPVIEINAANLYVNDPKSFDIRSIANAYDKVWSEATGIKGNDISSQINFVAPELTAALASGVACGEFPVTMTVVNAYARKVVTKTATVKIVDTIAPVIESRDVTLNYGEDFHFLDGVYFAYDNVNGNMFDYSKFMFNAEQDEVNTLEPGEYTVVVSVMDASGNSAETEYTVYVNEKEVDLSEVVEKIEDLESAIEDTEATLSDKVDDAQDAITGGQDQITEDIAGVEDVAGQNPNAGTLTGILVVAIIAAVAAAVSVFVAIFKK